jgi:hypothetical protein
MADFIADTSMRIQARNLRAEPVIANLTGIKRFTAKTSLMLANTVDRFGGWMSDGTSSFVAGALFGSVRGAIAGGFAAGVLALLGPLSILAAPVAWTLFGGFMLHDAARSYNKTKANDPRYTSARRADTIAKFGGAIDTSSGTPELSRQDIKNLGPQQRATDEVATQWAQNMDLNPQPGQTQPSPTATNSYGAGNVKPGGFAEAELRRRSQQQTQGFQKGGI